MSVKYILQRVGRKMGLDPTNPKQRETLVLWLNEAAEELYDQCDMDGIIMEQAFKVNGDQTISCPWYVGSIRGVRELASQQVWHVNKLRPRYNQFNWEDQWRNYRLKGKQALQATVTNESFGVLTVPFVETPNLIVTVTGPTATSTNMTEDVVMNAISVETQNAYLDYTIVKKNAINQYDVTLSDIDGKLLTTIPNNMYEAQYQIVDVSSAPWLSQNTSVLDNYVEILYKKALPVLWNDGDSFPATKDYDNILVNKILQLWGEEQGKPEMALAYDTKATRSLARKHENENRDTEDKVALVANPHDTVLPRVSGGARRKRYNLYGGRSY